MSDPLENVSPERRRELVLALMETYVAASTGVAVDDMRARAGVLAEQMLNRVAPLEAQGAATVENLAPLQLVNLAIVVADAWEAQDYGQVARALVAGELLRDELRAWLEAGKSLPARRAQ